MHRRRHGRGRAVRGRLTRILACALLAAASPAAAALDGVAVEYYDVAAPAGHPGTASWNLSYKYTARVPSEGGCAVQTITTALDLKLRMPRWTPASDASAALVSRWQRYLGALEAHEQGHLQHGRDFERAFLAASRGLRAASCDALSALLRARFDELLEQARRRDADYDAQTRHGATQGAAF